MAIKDDITWRTTLVYTFIVFGCCLIVLQAVLVMTVDGKKWRDRAEVNTPPQPIGIAPNRGDICATDGRILATSVPYYELRFDPIAVNKKVFQEKVDSLAHCLAVFFQDGSAKYYREKLTRARSGKHPNRYLQINKRLVNHTELKKVRNFPIFRLGKNKGGFQAIVSSRRMQPHVNLAVRTIGYLNESEEGGRMGRVGLEAAFEPYLKGENGQGIKRMMSGTWVVLTQKEPVDGNDIITTIDVDYQDIVQHALKKQLEKSNATNGTAILMEVKTGDIKAMANMSKVGDGMYVENQNFAISGAGEPGSVIKAATMIALLEDGVVRSDDTIDLGKSGRYKFYDRYLNESHDGLGRITVKQIMEKSANGIAKLVYDYYKERPEKFVNRWCAMGLDEKVGICLPGEADPYIKYPKKDKSWSGITLPWMSIGYELKMTPLQILCFYNAIANDGQRMRPRLVKEIRCRGEVMKSFDAEEVGSRICSRSTLNQLQEMLEGVVSRGTAQNIHTSKYQIAGKTGTARMARATSGYTGGRYRASFVGYFPADKPLYSCIVVIDNPTNGYYATTVSAPVVREIADKVYSMAYVQYGKTKYKPDPSLPVCKNGLKKDFKTLFNALDFDMEGFDEAADTDWVLTASEESEKMTVKPRKVDFSSVPNVKGMGLRDALYVLENSGLKVGVSGSGMVQQQSLQAGREVVRGSYIQIELR